MQRDWHRSRHTVEMDTGKDWSEEMMNRIDKILDDMNQPTWTFGNQDDWDKLVKSRDAWKKLAEELAQGYSYDDEDDEDIIQCVHCLAYVQNKNAKCEDIEHFPDCPIEQLAELQRSEG